MLVGQILSSPVWQGVGVILALLLGLIGFYFSNTKRDKRWLYAAALIVLVIITFGIGAEAQRQSNDTVVAASASGTSAPIAIDATQAKWQSTGVRVTAGQLVTIHVIGGHWTVSRSLVDDTIHKQLAEPLNKGDQLWQYSWRENNGIGSSSNPCLNGSCPLPNIPTGALVAKIGNTRYAIYNQCTFSATDTGEILLRMNDTDVSDNGGILAVEVNIERDSTSNISTNCGVPVGAP